MPTPRALLDELAESGLAVEDIWDVVQTRRRYAKAIPVLLDWLRNLDQRVTVGQGRDHLREALIRALTVPDGRPVAASQIMEELRRCSASGHSSTAWAAGNALAVVADDSVYQEVKVLALDTSLGKAREMLPLALARMKNPDATPTLVALLSDPDVSGHAVEALARRGDPVGIRALEPFSEDKRAWVRRKARQALQRLAAG